jgi:hypothetical protein
MEPTQIQYTTQNPYNGTIKLVIQSPDDKPPLQLDLYPGDQVTFPMQVPQGYMVKISKLLKNTRKDIRFKNIRYVKRYALVLDPKLPQP